MLFVQLIALPLFHYMQNFVTFPYQCMGLLKIRSISSWITLFGPPILQFKTGSSPIYQIEKRKQYTVHYRNGMVRDSSIKPKYMTEVA